ncbi:DUF2243 domain-containing protein [Lederbergia sp. NSJ-179]|uniref:DUF2243 domain-containing protein n=1 Tax=Lederbergia sp. NSJ-179 TaxID=2931402 RepID=UPI001FD207FB|nr:DUF2243 domain-containing protein [Lederbergia sp. NSJ-179]MCJ7843482.1 DUF2243 domain-containing protein [Lederbergia sp. NSJ-179]
MKNRSFIGAFVFGMGIIGMLDGIFLHQIFQFHSIYMYTNRFNQIVSDGLFHLFVTVIMFIGGYLLWESDSKKLHKPKHIFWAGILLGGGIFNLIEGIVNHHLLQIHHVYYHTNHVLLFDLLYDAFSLILIALGLYLLFLSKKKTK